MAAALHLAATLPPASPACGLATGPLLAADLIRRPLVARRGRMALPEGPGLGVEVDEEKVIEVGSNPPRPFQWPDNRLADGSVADY